MLTRSRLCTLSECLARPLCSSSFSSAGSACSLAGTGNSCTGHGRTTRRPGRQQDAAPPRSGPHDRGIRGGPSCSASGRSSCCSCSQRATEISSPGVTVVRAGGGRCGPEVRPGSIGSQWLRPGAGAFCCTRLNPDTFGLLDVRRFYDRLAERRTVVAPGPWFGDSAQVMRTGLAPRPRAEAARTTPTSRMRLSWRATASWARPGYAASGVWRRAPCALRRPWRPPPPPWHRHWRRPGPIAASSR